MSKSWNWWDDIKYYTTLTGLTAAFIGIILLIAAYIIAYITALVIFFLLSWKLLTLLI